MNTSSNSINISSEQSLKPKEKQTWIDFYTLQIGYKAKAPYLCFV